MLDSGDILLSPPAINKLPIDRLASKAAKTPEPPRSRRYRLGNRRRMINRRIPSQGPDVWRPGRLRAGDSQGPLPRAGRVPLEKSSISC